MEVHYNKAEGHTTEVGRGTILKPMGTILRGRGTITSGGALKRGQGAYY